MAIPISDNIRSNSNKPLDYKFGPFISVAQANSIIPIEQRHNGLIFGVYETPGDIPNSKVEYYKYKNGLTDIDLEPVILKDEIGGVAANDTSILSVDTVDEFTGLNRRGRTRIYVNDVIRGGMFTFRPLSDSLIVNNTTVYSLPDGYAVRSFEGAIQDEWSDTSANYDPSNEASGTNDGSKLNTILNSLPDGSIYVLRKDANYRIDSPIILTDKNINIDLNGSTLWQTSNIQLLRYENTFEWTESVVAITIQNENFGGVGGVSFDYCRIELSAVPSGTKKGDIVKLTSEDHIFGTIAPLGDVRPRMGQMFPIINVTGNYIYVSIPVEFSAYVTGLRLSKFRRETITIKNGFVSSIDTNNGWSTGLVFITNSSFSSIESVSSKKSWGSVFELRGCYMPKVKDPYFSSAETEVGLRVGYGIRDFGCHYGMFSGIRASNVRHAYSTNQSTVSDLQTTEIWRYGRNFRSKIFDGIGVSCDSAPFDTHAGAYEIDFTNCHSYDSYPGASSLGPGFVIRGIGITVNNCSARGRVGINIPCQYPNGTSRIRVKNSYFEGENSYRGSLSNGGTRIEDIVFEDCSLVSTSTGLTLLEDSDTEFINCEFLQKILTGAPRFFNLFRASVKVKRCTFKYPSGTGSLRLVFVNTNDCFTEIVDSKLETGKGTFDRLISASTFTHTTYISNLKSDKPITEVFDNDVNGVIKYNYDIVNYLENTGSRNISQNFSTTSSINIGKLLDKEIFVRASLSGNVTISAIEDGTVINQKLKITNTAGAFILTIPHGGNITLLSEASKVIQPKNGTILLYWNSTAWEEEVVRPDLLPQSTSSDANFSVLAFADYVILDSTLTADRTLTLRTAASFKDKKITIINKNSGAFFWRCSPAITLPDGTTTIPIDNQSVYTLLSDGTVWRVISKI